MWEGGGGGLSSYLSMCVVADLHQSSFTPAGLSVWFVFPSDSCLVGSLGKFHYVG